MKTRVYWQAVGAAALLIVSGSGRLRAASPPPSAAAADPKPFLSAATKLVTTDPAKKTSEVRIRPTKDAVEAPFYDAAFAINIPVEMRHEGGLARVMWRVTVSWDNPPKEWGESHWNLGGGNIGFYRMDGRSLEQAKFKSWVGQKWEGDAPLPTVVFNLMQRSIEPEKAKHQPFEKGSGDSFLMNPAEPGWYAVWYAFEIPNGIWPAKEPKRDVLSGTIHIDTLVSRGEDEPTKAEVEYLAGRGKRPERMQEDKFYKLATTDLPFKLRRDGWVFDHAELRVPEKERDKVDKKRILLGGKQSVYRTFTCLQKVGGTEADISVTEKIQSEPRVPVTDAPIPDQDQLFESVYLIESNWKASFPPSIPDNSFGILKFTGKQQQRFQQKPAGQTQIPATSFSWEPLPPGKVINEKTKEEEKVGEHQTWGLLPMEKSAESGKEEIRKKFLNDYGQDAGEWFVPGFFENVRGGPKEGEPPYQYVIRGRYPPRKSAEVSEIGPYPLLGYQIGPWQLLGYYKRQSEVEGRTVASKSTAGEATVVSDADKFWEWFPELSAVIRKQKPIADKAVTDAALETLPLQHLLHSQKRLLVSLAQDSGKAGVLESLAGWLDDAVPKTGIGTLPGGSDPGSVNTPVAVSPEQTIRTRNKLGEINEDIRHARERIKDHTADARAAYQEIRNKLEEGNENFGGPAHGELYNWRQHYKKIFERISYDIALASRDPEILRRELAEGETEGHSEQTRIVEAQLQMALGNSVAALYALRSAVEVSKTEKNPTNAVAVKMLQDLECTFLKEAIEKSQGTIQKARQAFYGYMMERGFTDHHLRQGGDWPFARAMAWTEYALSKYGEVPWAIFTTGLFGSMSALVDSEGGKPAAEADLLATTETRMTTAFIGLNTILRLRGNGSTFAEIQEMKSMEIRDRLPLRNLNGDYYSDHDAALHRVAIREAMALPDIQALVTNDRLGLQLGLEKKYWRERDVGDTWVEWIGDITSMYNLFLILPGAKVGTAGRVGAFWGAAELEMIQALERSGEVISGTEAVANTIGLTQLLGAAGATDNGKTVLKYLKALGKYEEGLKWYDKVIWTSGKLTGMLTINFTTVIATEKLFGHKAAMLMQSALMFGSDPGTLVKLLDAQNIPRQKVAQLIINEYLPATQLHLKRLAQMEKSSFQLEQLFEQVKNRQRLSAEDIAFLDKHFAKENWRRLIPNGQASHDSSIALAAAAEGAKSGVNNGAGRAISGDLKAARDAEAAATNRAHEKAQRLVAQLQNAPPPVRGPPPPVQPPRPPRDLKRATLIELRAEAHLNAYPMPPRPPRGSECAKAEALLHLGKYHEAQAKYEEVIERILKGELFIADEMPLEYIHLKRCLAYDLQVCAREAPLLDASVLSRPIPPGDVEKILSNPDLWRGNPKKGAMGNVYTIEGNDEYFVKTVTHKTYDEVGGVLKTVKQIDVLADVEANLAHHELARALGFDVPAMEVRLVRDANGQIEKAFYVMRRVKGKQLAEYSAGEIFLFKDELSRHRALSTLLGDWDRKIDNYMVMDGRLVSIDAGLADVTGKRVTDAGFAVDEAFTMEGGAGRDHWLSRFYKDEMCAKSANGTPLGVNAPRIELWEPSESFARKGLVAEEALTYQATKPTINDIMKLVDPANEERLRKLLEDAFMKVHGNEFEIERLMKRLIDNKKAVGEIVDLTRPEVREALRQEVIGRIKSSVIEPKITDSLEFLRARAKKLDKCMQGLNDRNAVPLVYWRPQVDPFDDSLMQRVVLLHFLNNVTIRRAA